MDAFDLHLRPIRALASIQSNLGIFHFSTVPLEGKSTFQLYMPIVDEWIFVNNSSIPFRTIAHGTATEAVIHEEETWSQLKALYDVC